MSFPGSVDCGLPLTLLFRSCLVALSTCIGLLIFGTNTIQGPKDLAALWKLGLGAVDFETIIAWELPQVGAAGLICNFLVANIAQAILSFIYFAYNGLFTSMLAGREWSRFATQRKGLRISGVPSGSQRSTYFLQLPYRFAVPLMIMSGLLHWLVSQSIFLVAIEELPPSIPGQNITGYDQKNIPLSADDYSGYGTLTCGYSPLAIILVIITGFSLMLATILLGCRRYEAGIPLAGNCSAVISAACHPEGNLGDADAAYLPLRWGVTHSEGDIGHCAFSAEKVGFPEEDHLYAGLSGGNVI